MEDPMISRLSMALAPIAALAFSMPAWREAQAAPLPTKVGQCSETKVKTIGYRLGTPDSGSAISYVNGGVQVSYDTIPAIHRSKVGDSVKLCLVSVPQDCPPGDDRGKVYHATNLRTKGEWEAPDSQHMCGGA
jgi:hypothetical protein